MLTGCLVPTRCTLSWLRLSSRLMLSICLLQWRTPEEACFGRRAAGSHAMQSSLSQHVRRVRMGAGVQSGRRSSRASPLRLIAFVQAKHAKANIFLGAVMRPVPTVMPQHWNQHIPLKWPCVSHTLSPQSSSGAVGTSQRLLCRWGRH